MKKKYTTNNQILLFGCVVVPIILVISFLFYYLMAWLIWNILAVSVFGVTALSSTKLAGFAAILWILSILFYGGSSK